MQFNVADLGLCQDTDFLLSTDSTSYPVADKARNMNRHLDNAVSLILQADGRWQWDDTNNTDLPIVTTTLVDSQQDYGITGQTFLSISRVEVMDSSGNYRVVDPIDQHDVTSQALTEFQKTAGMPRYYDKIGDSIFLYPKPSSSLVTLTAGLNVYFQRIPTYFTAASTTAVPGINPLFHRYLSIGAALDYAIANQMNGKINTLTPMMEKIEESMITSYSARSKDESVRIRPHREDYGQASGDMGIARQSDLTAF